MPDLDHSQIEREEREPAEVFCLAEFLCEEMQARGWTTVDVALRMGDTRDYGTNKFIVDLALAVQEDRLLYDDETIRGLARAFGVSADCLRNLDATWRKYPDRRAPFEAPEAIFGED